MNALHNFLFIVLPYIAFAVFVVGSIYRYRRTKYAYSSLSSQFLEGKKLFWGSVPFHFGLMVVFFGHLIAFMFPRTILAWNSYPVRLIILEATGFIFGLSLVAGLVNLLIRRVMTPRIRAVSNKMDIIVLLLLLCQSFLGCWIAIGYRWGSSWFASDLSPYLWSIIKLDPQIGVVKLLPLVIQLHIIGAFVIVLIIPFTRLVHFLVFPVFYIFRPYQKVIWNWDRKTINDAGSPWSKTRPKNN
ncbi:MAG: respiratory nitrate reductase subunit gamma [Candidatus Omnitrophica bacterium]|nr:respiratory nitrate reductase subunit gamma [Candidatus Omnitrophota bacterium]